VTEAERKARGEKSAVIVERLVRVQLRAMGCERFDLGIKRDAGEMILREGQGALEIEATTSGSVTKMLRALISTSVPQGSTA
jgi:hypothetical protein